MVFINVRITVADYSTWRKFFDDDEARRRAGGARGVNQLYRDADDPNTINLILEWDNAENARKFLDDPALREVMQESGVIGAPAVRSVLTRA
jgi:quinol monooxygenase YgiN